MQIRGKLSDRTPADLLEWLHREKRTGVLRFWLGNVRKDAWYEKGEIVSSGTSEPREFLGSYLIASGRITENDFVRAYRTQVETKVLFGKVLVMFGLVSEKEVEVALKGKTEETIWEVFLWRDGLFEFDDGASLPPQRLQMHVDVAKLVEEGERRVIEWGVIRQTFPHANVEVKVHLFPAKIATLGPTEKRVLDLLRTGRPVAQAAVESRLSPFLFLRKLNELKKNGLVELLRVLEEIPSDALRPLTDPGAIPSSMPSAPSVPKDPGVSATQRFAIGKETLSADDLKSRIPILKIPKQKLLEMKFTPEEGYLLSRVDGVFDVGTVSSLCPYKEQLAFTLLSALAARGIVELQRA